MEMQKINKTSFHRGPGAWSVGVQKAAIPFKQTQLEENNSVWILLIDAILTIPRLTEVKQRNNKRVISRRLFIFYSLFVEAPQPEEHLRPRALDPPPTAMWPVSGGAKVSVIVRATVIGAGGAPPPPCALRLLFGSKLKDLELVIPHPGLAPVTHFSLVHLFEPRRQNHLCPLVILHACLGYNFVCVCVRVFPVCWSSVRNSRPFSHLHTTGTNK